MWKVPKLLWILFSIKNEFLTSFSYDGAVYHNHADSKNDHYLTTLAKIDACPLAVGGYSSNTNKAETYDFSTNTWTEVADYPYHD